MQIPVPVTPASTVPLPVSTPPVTGIAGGSASDPFPEMREAVARAPQDSVIMQSSRPVRVLQGAALGVAGGAGGALAAGAVTSLATNALFHLLPTPLAGSLPALLMQSQGLAMGAGLAVAASIGAVAGAYTVYKATAGDHAGLFAMRDAANAAGRLEGAVALGAAGAAAGAMLGHPVLALALGALGAVAGSKVGSFVGAVAGNLGGIIMKHNAGQAGSIYHETPPPTAPSGPVSTSTPPAAPVGANRFTPLVDDDVLTRDAMAEVARATKSIVFETYLLNGPDGKAFCDLLVQKQKEGVDVKVILDPFFQGMEGRMQEGDPQYGMAHYLKENGVDCVTYPLSKLSGSLTPSEHAKVLVIDDHIAYVGGTNIDDTMNHDVNVKIEGPAALDVKAFFEESWVVATDPDPQVLGLARDPVGKSPDISIYTTSPSRSTVKEAILTNIREARESIKVEMFTLTDKDMVRELEAAAKRGVDVQVILCDNKEIFHLPTFHIPNLPTAIKMHDGNVQVRWYENSRFTQMHSKLAVFDHEKVMVGSANWIHNAFRGIHEYYTEIRDTDLAGKMEAQFAEDWQKCARPVEDPTRGQRILGAVVDGASGVIF